MTPDLESLRQARLRRRPNEPLLTQHDLSRGSRAEISATTFDNWVRKTASMLEDDIELDPSATILVRLPAHWVAAVWIAAAWSAGAAVDLSSPGDGSDSDADLVVVGPGDATTYGGGPLVVVSLHPLGLPEPRAVEPSGTAGLDWFDFADAVRACPDSHTPRGGRGPASAAIRAAGRTWTDQELIDSARDARGGSGQDGERVAVVSDIVDIDWVSQVLVRPWIRGGSAILVTGGGEADPTAIDDLIRREGASGISG